MASADTGFTWKIPPTEAWPQLYDAWFLKVYTAVGQVLQMRAPEIENWMKANAPWTDRTGNARQTLWTAVIPALYELLLIMAHGMTYGIYLETMRLGTYAIVTKAVDYWTPILLDDLRALGFRVT